MVKMIFLGDGRAELWNHQSNECLAAGKINAKSGEDGHDPFLNFAIALTEYKGDIDPANPIKEGFIILRD